MSYKNYTGAFVFTIVAVVVTFLSFKLGSKFLGGIILASAGTNSSFYWTSVMFGSREEAEERIFRKVGYYAIITSILIGLLNYLLLMLLNFGSSDFLIAIAVIIPIFLNIYVDRIIFYVFPRERIDEIITFIRFLLISLVADVGALAIILGLKLSLG